MSEELKEKSAVANDLILSTQRLLLRPISNNAEDVELVWRVSRIPGFTDGMGWSPPRDKSEIQQTAEKFIAGWQAGQQYVFTIFVEDERAVGRVAIERMAEASSDDVWSLGYWIDPAYWGQGIAHEAAAAVLEFAETRLLVKTVKVAHVTWNDQSRRVIEKLGFTLLGTNPCGLIKDGQPIEEFEYELTFLQNT